MQENIKYSMDEQIQELADLILSTYTDDPVADRMDTFNQPDQQVIIEIINKLLRLMYPGFLRKGTGIVVGETTVIGDNVKLYQSVTLGALSTRDGQKLRGVRRHPTIEDNVTIYAGASILGGNTVIGHDSVIGSNVFVTSSIAPGSRISIKSQELEIRGGRFGGVPEPWDDYVI